MNDMQELFKKQLDTTSPCDGDYLKGRTIEEAANELFTNLTENGNSTSLEKIQEHVSRSTADWKLHKGERMLFAAEQMKSTIHITKIWESELEKYVDKPFVRYMSDDDIIPLFDMESLHD